MHLFVDCRHTLRTSVHPHAVGFVLSCFVLFCVAFSCFVLFCVAFSCFVLFCFVLFLLVLCCCVLFCVVVFCFVLFVSLLLCFGFSFFVSALKTRLNLDLR